jgi:hypothetical protein
MTKNEEECSMLVIDFCRRHFRKLGAVEFVSWVRGRRTSPLPQCTAPWIWRSIRPATLFPPSSGRAARST